MDVSISKFILKNLFLFNYANIFSKISELYHKICNCVFQTYFKLTEYTFPRQFNVCSKLIEGDLRLTSSVSENTKKKLTFHFRSTVYNIICEGIVFTIMNIRVNTSKKCA